MKRTETRVKAKEFIKDNLEHLSLTRKLEVEDMLTDFGQGLQIRDIGNYLRDHLEPILPRFQNGSVNWSETERETGVHYQILQRLMDSDSNLTERNINKLLVWIDQQENKRSNR